MLDGPELFVNPDYTRRPEPEALFPALRELATHGAA